MYILAKINGFGYVKGSNEVDGSEFLIHKETLNLHIPQPWFYVPLYYTLDAAKEDWEGPESDQVILGLTSEGQVEKIWMHKQQQDRLVRLLKRFSGCYGHWPVSTISSVPKRLYGA